MFHPKHPKKISGCCPKSKKKCISTAIPSPKNCALRLRALQASTAVAPAAAYMVNDIAKVMGK